MTQEKTLSKDTNTALREVATTIKKMEAVFVEETEALNKTDNHAFMALQDRKLVVAREYQNDMGQMLARKCELSTADPTIRNNLKQMQEKFADISKKNIEAIDRMQRCTERLGDTIRNAAIKSAQKHSGYSYGNNGAISPYSKKRAVSTGLSETV